MPKHVRPSTTVSHTGACVVRLSAILLLILSVVWSPATVTAKETAKETAAKTAQEIGTTTNQCFVVADGYINDQGDPTEGADTLAYLRLQTGEAEPVGGRIPNLNTTNIEAIAFKPNSAQLYAANGDRLGILDLVAATFTGFPNPFGASGAQTFNDVDGLSFNPLTGDLWGVNVNTAALDVLFKIELTNGSYIPGAFEDPNNPGQPVDYLTIQSGSIVDDIDDIAIDPVDGLLYAVVTSLNSVASLAVIDTTDGTVTRIGQFTRQATGAPLQEVEGLGFGSDGQLYGSTGNAGNDRNLLWRVDKTTGVATLIGEFDDRLIDIEALDCLGSAGFLVFESYVNGVDADSAQDALTVRAGDPLTRTYLIRNTGAYTLSKVTVVDDSGTPNEPADDTTVCQDVNIPIGQSHTCQQNIVASSGQYSLTATVTATDTLGNSYMQQDVTYYVGYTGAAVGGRVWNDRNGNGIADPAESNAGIDGVTVTLYNNSGGAMDSVQTSGGGAYLFNDLLPGVYSLGVQLPARHDFTIKDASGNDEVDSDFEPNPAAVNFGRTDTFTLADGVIDQSWDAGLRSQVTTGSISGYTWHDLNGDGIQNDGAREIVAMGGVTVTLSQRVEVRSAQVLSTTVTGGDGAYRFDEIAAGDYYVEFTAPSGYTFTVQNAGDSELVDSDADPVSGRTGIVEVSPGQNQDHVDAGLRQDEIMSIYLPNLAKP